MEEEMEQKLFTELRPLYTTSKESPDEIRIRIRMRDLIYSDVLRHAVDSTMERYPYFCVELLKKGEQYFFAENHRPVVITNSLHGVDLNSEDSNFHMIAFCFLDNWIILDVFHGMTDGTGAYEVLRTLLYYYCSERYQVKLNDEGIRLVGDTISEEQQKLYDKVKTRVKDDTLKFRVMSNNDLQRNKNALLAIITRLRQATSCPKAITTEDISSSKLDRAKDLIEELVSQNEKVCVFASFKESVYELANMIKEYHPLVATGDQSEQEIDRTKQEFQDNPNEKVLLATWQKMGTGLTLTAASYMICIDTAWTAAVQEQTEDRIYRIGADRPVFIYRLICENTIDERVQQLLEKKKAMSDYLIDGEVSEKDLELLRDYVMDL